MFGPLFTKKDGALQGSVFEYVLQMAIVTLFMYACFVGLFNCLVVSLLDCLIVAQLNNCIVRRFVSLFY